MLRRLNEQVIVITGASSGVGRETAIEAGRRGASVVLAARSEDALREAAQEIERSGGKALAVVTDVAEWLQVKHLAEEAVARFGRIDSWVNNAAVAEYATVEDMSIEEIDRIIRVILMGQIYGMKAALTHMKRAGSGVIINVASALAKRSIPLQSAYCAAKHGIKGFTESLRMELEHEKSGIKVVLVLPGSINTPLFEHARSKVGVQPMPVPPIYQPQVVSEAILFAMEHPRREIVVGGGGEILAFMEKISPMLMDWYMLRKGRLFRQQLTDSPDDGRDNLFTPMSGTGRVKGLFEKQSKSTSMYTWLFELHPNLKRAALGIAGIGLLALLRRSR